MGHQLDDLLDPFFGYVHLKMYDEASEVLENLPPELKTDPTVLLARLDLVMAMEMWEEGAVLGKSLCEVWPAELEFWFRTAYCQHELKRTQEAKDTLLHAPEGIRETATYCYNLACYETQLGNLAEGKRLLKICFGRNKAFREESVNDPDLKPLWDSLENL
jgi:tetratricopeptide (TPR) repeat protein